MPRLASPDAETEMVGLVEVDVAVELERGAFAGQPQLRDVEHVLIERELDRPVALVAGSKLLTR